MRTSICIAALGWLTCIGNVRAEEPKKIDPVQMELQLINKDLAEIKDLLKTINALELGLRLDTAENDIAAMKARLESLENRTLVNEQQLRDKGTRIAKSIDPNPGQGTIQLNNRSSVQVTFILDNVTYPLEPGQSRTLSRQKAGSFVYEVLAEGFGVIQPPRTRVLQQNEVKTITVDP